VDNIGPGRWRTSPRFRHKNWSHAVCGRQLPDEWIEEMSKNKKPPSGPSSPGSPGRPPGPSGPDKNPPFPPKPPRVTGD
jgi:hypothetical protein